ncbi:MAG: excinuclease ABC subunit UvrC [Lachnospiraceae bacterium]|nr:excinuclease ABC subunit UvrC [Lachnospiraceae bacterium]
MEGFDIKEELKKLPDNPGVYIMHDAHDNIIYVGKAVSLRKRVRSYFRESTPHTAKINKMISLVDYFEYIITDSELEALVLENNLIKEHSPKYNTLLKDDKTYPYIKVTVNEAYPRIISTRRVLRDKARYFGPFTSGSAVNTTIEYLRNKYLIRDCNYKIDKGEITRACISYEIKRCKAPCIGAVSKEEYDENVSKVLDFLGGKISADIKELEDKMRKFSEELEFEKANEIKLQIEDIKFVTQKQKITLTNDEDKDYIALARNDIDVIVSVFFVREGKLLGREHHYMKHALLDTDEEIIDEFIKQFYQGTPYIPREIYIPVTLEDKELLERFLASKREGAVSLITPLKGQKEKMLSLARENAQLILDRDSEKIKLQEARSVGAAKEIGDLLGLPIVSRMEAYDISNISGFANVGSMVVFVDGKPKKSDYRKFRIKSVAGPNDYACMEEVLTRRFENHAEILPDLILMDGGRGQVNICLKVLEKLGIDVPVCGMVKDDKHRTRGVFYNNVELPIDTSSNGFKLVTRIQDEAHRFAIEYHRLLRTKAQVHSVLDDIPGVGPSRRRLLMKEFSSIDELKEASVERLCQIDGIPKNAAEAIYEFFRQSENNEDI